MSAVKVKNKPVPNKIHVASATSVTQSDALTDAVDPLPTLFQIEPNKRVS